MDKVEPKCPECASRVVTTWDINGNGHPVHVTVCTKCPWETAKPSH